MLCVSKYTHSTSLIIYKYQSIIRSIYYKPIGKLFRINFCPRFCMKAKILEYFRLGSHIRGLALQLVAVWRYQGGSHFTVNCVRQRNAINPPWTANIYSAITSITVPRICDSKGSNILPWCITNPFNVSYISESIMVHRGFTANHKHSVLIYCAQYRLIA